MMKPVCLGLSLFTALMALQSAVAAEPETVTFDYGAEVYAADAQQAFLNGMVQSVLEGEPAPVPNPVMVITSTADTGRCRLQSSHISFTGGRQTAAFSEVVHSVQPATHLIVTQDGTIRIAAKTETIPVADTLTTPVHIARD